ncbi:MAG: hypothetical protein IJU62_03725, partial [Muribaculaceae bacterium]|nr:hypothetical protein [Muribaculaceae bacterium]
TFHDLLKGHFLLLSCHSEKSVGWLIVAKVTNSDDFSFTLAKAVHVRFVILSSKRHGRFAHNSAALHAITLIGKLHK